MLLANFENNVGHWKAIEEEKKVIDLDHAVLDYGRYGAHPPLAEAERQQIIEECCRPPIAAVAEVAESSLSDGEQEGG